MKVVHWLLYPAANMSNTFGDQIFCFLKNNSFVFDTI
jgi:hypothetical protein